MNPEKAIDTAYNKDVSALYKTLSQVILSANGDEAEIAAAEARFAKGTICQRLSSCNRHQRKS